MNLTDQCPKGSKAELCLSVREFSEGTKIKGHRLQVVVDIKLKGKQIVRGRAWKKVIGFFPLHIF
jgi:hypothetical protein